MKKIAYYFESIAKLELFLKEHRQLQVADNLSINVVCLQKDATLAKDIIQTLQKHLCGTAIALSYSSVKYKDTPVLINFYSMQPQSALEFDKLQESVNAKLQPQQVSRLFDCMSAHLQHKKTTFHQSLQKHIDAKRAKELLVYEQNKLSQMKEMVSMIAHHWRQPLNSISSLAMELEVAMSIDEVTPKQMQQGLQKIQEKTRNLSKVITIFSSFLDTATKPSRCNIHEIANEVKALFETQLKNEKIEFINKIDKDCEVTVPKQLFKQVFLNLVSNAIDAFSGEKVQNKYVVADIKETKEGIELSIEDSAGGVTAQNEDKIFNPYFTTKIDENATGLGLFVSKQIMQEALRGDLRYEKKKNGSRFVMVLQDINRQSKRDIYE
ncbi:MAG: sensor histidine kinase [Campylobacterota bacterium]